MAGRTLVTPPLLEPLTLAEAKLFLKVDLSADDALITDLIIAARKRCEDWRGQSFLTQTWDFFLDSFPRWYDAYTLDGGFTPFGAQSWFGTAAYGRREPPILLPRPPLQSVTSVKYTPYNAAQATLDPATYQVDVSNTLAPRIAPNFDKLWPTDVLQSVNGVVVRMVTGYGAAAANVPEQIRLALKELVAYWYYNRNAVGSIPEGINELLAESTGGFTYA